MREVTSDLAKKGRKPVDTYDKGVPPITGPAYPRARAVLRILGPSFAAIGLVLIVIGFESFFRSFGSGSLPHHFWCAFVGMPLLFVGFVLSSAGYAAVFHRSMYGEMAPVQKDAFHYLARETRGSARGLAQAIGEGLTAGFSGGSTCPRCKRQVPTGSHFCPHCATAVSDPESH